MGSYAFGAIAPTSTPTSTTSVATRDISMKEHEHGQFKASLPCDTCGYGDIEYDTSYTTLSTDDTIYVYFSTDPSNCAAQESDLGCISQMTMTGSASELGFIPYTVWYYFEQIGDDGPPLVKLYFNYNNSATHLVASVPCNVDQYIVSLSKCMFNRDWLVYKFFTRYLFKFYLTCDYNSDLDTIDFNLDQAIKTYNGDLNNDGVCNEVNNRFNLASFQAWHLSIGIISAETEPELCIDNPPDLSQPSSVETVTSTIVTTSTSTPTPTDVATTSVDNGNGGTVIINIKNKK